MSSPIDFEMVQREFPNYLAPEKVEAVADNVAIRNLALLSTFSSEAHKRARLLVKAETKELELAPTPGWGYSWSTEQKKQMLQVVAASFYFLRKAVAEHPCRSFNEAEAKEPGALAGLHQLALVIERYWKDQELANQAWALRDKLMLPPVASGTSSVRALTPNTVVERGRNSPVQQQQDDQQFSGNGGGSPAVELERRPSPMASSRKVDQAWRGCLQCLPYFRSSPCCYPPSWCVGLFKPAVAME